MNMMREAEHLAASNARKSGDVTATAELWKLTGDDFGTSISTVAVHEGLVYAIQQIGFIDCIELETGKRVWQHDMLAVSWGSPLVADSKLYSRNGDGDVIVMKTGREKVIIAKNAEALPSVDNGSVVAANQVLVFFDPQCPHCAALWTSSQPLLRKLKMVWMPVGILRPQSTPQGALLLSAKDPAATMTEHETLLSNRKGGLPVPDKVDDAQVAKVKANTDLLQKLGADSVPFILYKNAKTGVYGSHAGGVSTEQLAQMVGVGV